MWEAMEGGEGDVSVEERRSESRKKEGSGEPWRKEGKGREGRKGVFILVSAWSACVAVERQPCFSSVNRA